MKIILFVTLYMKFNIWVYNMKWLLNVVVKEEYIFPSLQVFIAGKNNWGQQSKRRVTVPCFHIISVKDWLVPLLLSWGKADDPVRESMPEQSCLPLQKPGCRETCLPCWTPSSFCFYFILTPSKLLPMFRVCLLHSVADPHANSLRKFWHRHIGPRSVNSCYVQSNQVENEDKPTYFLKDL